MSNVPEGAQLSEDGQYYWDGTDWQLVEGAEGAAGTEGTEGAGGEGGGAGDITAEELEPVGDSGAETGNEDLLDDRLRPYFEPSSEGVEDDESLAEVDATLDEDAFTGGSDSEETQGDSDG